MHGLGRRKDLLLRLTGGLAIAVHDVFQEVALVRFLLGRGYWLLRLEVVRILLVHHVYWLWVLLMLWLLIHVHQVLLLLLLLIHIYRLPLLLWR